MASENEARIKCWLSFEFFFQKLKFSDLAAPSFAVGDVVSVVDLDELSNQLVVSKPGQEEILELITHILAEEPKVPLKSIPEADQVSRVVFSLV